MTDDDTLDDDAAIARHAARLVSSARDHLDLQSKGRQEALEYYRGEIKDLPTKAGRSSVVSRDIRVNVKKVMPSIMRTLFGGGGVVKYLPVGQDDEQGAEQATDYVNHVTVGEADVKRACHDAIQDAILIKTGILKWSAYRERKVTIQDYTDQPDDAVVGLFDDPKNEILDHVKEPETDPDLLALDPTAKRHTFRLRRVTEKVCPRIEAVPRGSFLISADAESIEEAELVGEEQMFSRSKLVGMGYDRDAVWALARHDGKDDDDDDRKGADAYDVRAETRKATQVVRVWEIYIRIDLDGDGVAELHRLHFGERAGHGGTAETQEHIVLALEPVDEAPYAEVVIERDAHEFEGHSLSEDLTDVQRVKTALTRAALDNLYAHNNPRPVVNLSAVANPENLTKWSFGEPIVLNEGYNPGDVLDWQAVPFVADKSFAMLEYMDGVARDRTGITDASGGLDADSLHNTSATAANLMSESGIATADSIVRSIAEGGLKRAFRGLLRLVIAHADGERTVRMKGEWVTYDPRVWNVDMDCEVNVGLGGGSRERDMMMLQTVYGLQKEVVAAFGPDNPFVKPEQLYNTFEKIVETAGFPSALPFFTKPDPEEVAAKMEAAKNKPDPEERKVQAQIQIEQAKMEFGREKEAAQMDADLKVKMAELEKEGIARREELQAEMLKEDQRLAFEREKLSQERELRVMDIVARSQAARESAQARAQQPESANAR